MNEPTTDGFRGDEVRWVRADGVASSGSGLAGLGPDRGYTHGPDNMAREFGGKRQRTLKGFTRGNHMQAER